MISERDGALALMGYWAYSTETWTTSRALVARPFSSRYRVAPPQLFLCDTEMEEEDGGGVPPCRQQVGRLLYGELRLWKRP